MTKNLSKSRLKNLFAFFAALGIVSVARAQEIEPLVTDRPDFTESAQTIAPGRVQIESGVTFQRVGAARQRDLGEVLVRIGAGKRAEIRVGVPTYISIRDGGRVSGLDDASLGAKFRLTRPEKKTVIALIAGATLPTGSRRVAERKLSPEAVLSVELPSRGRWSLATNVGFGRPSEGGARFSQLFGSIAAGTDFSPRVGLFLELFAFNRDTPSGGTKKYFDGGFTYLLNPDFQLDVRGGVGLGNDTGGPDYFYGAGASRRF